MSVTILCLLAIIAALVWIVAQFIPSGRTAQIALICWVVIVTLAVCGFAVQTS